MGSIYRMMGWLGELAGTLGQESVPFRRRGHSALGSPAEEPEAVTGDPVIGRIAQGAGKNPGKTHAVPYSTETFRDTQGCIRFG